MNLRDKAVHFYIKNIKRHMDCPSCYGDKKVGLLQVDRKHNNWVCKDCGYTLSCKEFENGITFWFCDGCGTYLNKQDGFTEQNKRWICTKCGFENDVTAANIVNKCCGCGKIMPSDYEPLYCPECRQKRAEKVVEVLKLTSEICLTIAESLKEFDKLNAYSSNESLQDYAHSLSYAYDEASQNDKAIIEEAVYKATGTKLSSIVETVNSCANCGNSDSRTLFDEGETLYCSKCCHRTRKSDAQDDLVICPVCKHLKDRKAMYCQWCNNSDPDASYDPVAESNANEFESNVGPDNIRYFKLKGKRKL